MIEQIREEERIKTRKLDMEMAAVRAKQAREAKVAENAAEAEVQRYELSILETMRKEEDEERKAENQALVALVQDSEKNARVR